MAGETDTYQTWVQYVYFTEHRDLWRDRVPPHLAEIVKATKDMELRNRPTFFFPKFYATHEKVAQFVQSRCEEGLGVCLDIARTLEECKALYENGEETTKGILKEGKLLP